MKSYLICDDEDTLLGLKLAGIEGEIIAEKSEVLKRIDEKLADPGTGIILITQRIKSMAKDDIMERKLKSKKTLIVEVPSIDVPYEADFITRYIRESIGIKI
jgi:V/A-type H+/Na+-transporting ATPase subunit F